MKVLVFEDNLLWSSRFLQGLRKLGHEAELGRMVEDVQGWDAAIVNLGDPEHADPEFVGRLRSAGVRVIGHAGHKEKDLLALGRAAGCDRIATNGQITHRLADILESVQRKNEA